MILIAASCPSNKLAAVTILTLLEGKYDMLTIVSPKINKLSAPLPPFY
jgi:hypothetical protein